MKDIKLYDIPRDSRINCECEDGSSFIVFRRLDGMYSYCETEKGGVTHLSAVCPLEKDGEYYKIKKELE